MRKRKRPAVLRYHKSNRNNDYEGWMLKELMIYTHYREKDLDEFERSTAELYFEKKDWIRSVILVVMEHLESVEEAQYMVEQSTKEIDLHDIGCEISATHEQDQHDCLIKEVIEHPEYDILNTDGFSEVEGPKQPGSIFKKKVAPPFSELRRETQKMDEFQKEVLNIAIRYAKDVVKARRNGNKAPDPVYLIGHGGAGAGKSTVINLVSQWCHYILSKEGDDHGCHSVIKTAFTGTAAWNIG